MVHPLGFPLRLRKLWLERWEQQQEQRVQGAELIPGLSSQLEHGRAAGLGDEQEHTEQGGRGAKGAVGIAQKSSCNGIY